MSELWHSDGSVTGTKRWASLSDLSSGLGTYIEPVIRGDTMFVSVNYREGETHGVRLKTIDLLNAQELTLHQRANPCFIHLLNQPTPQSKTIFAESCDSDVQVWASDGSVAGTEILLGGDGSDLLQDLKPVRSKTQYALFFAHYGDQWSNSSQLFVSDGTAQGTRALRVLSPYFEYWPGQVSESHNGNPIFLADDKTGKTFWTSDGTFNGTKALVSLYTPTRDVSADANPRSAIVLGNEIAFIADIDSTQMAGYDRQSATVWLSDGTQSGTRMTSLPLPPLNTYVDYRLSSFDQQLLVMNGRGENGGDILEGEPELELRD